MLYAISDIHGRYLDFCRWVDLMGNFKPFETGEHKLILLGDYIDGGVEGFRVLKLVRAFSLRLGGSLVALRGNHEEDFLAFLDGADVWLDYSNDAALRGFLTEGQLEHLCSIREKAGAGRVYAYVRNCIRENHAPMIAWLRSMPYYYETERQIFVHAGVDEEAGEDWPWGTAEHVFTGKFPPETGRFYKDVIAGHVSARKASGDPAHRGVYFDGESHYYIDGGAEGGGALLCLAYDEKKQKYYELLHDGKVHGDCDRVSGTLKAL